MAAKKIPSTKRKKPIRLAPEAAPVDLYSAIYELETRAKRGDEAAAHELLAIAKAACHSVADLAVSPESREIAKKLASEELTWPVVASRFGRMEGNAKSVETYLDLIGLGSAWNLDPKTPRNFERQQLAWMIFRELRHRAIPTSRKAMSRNEWLASQTGKAVKAEIREILHRFFRDRWHDQPLMASFVSDAYNEPKRRGVKSPKMKRILSICVELIAAEIYAMSFD